MRIICVFSSVATILASRSVQKLFVFLFVYVCCACYAVPDGFEMTVLTDEVPNARQMAESDEGILFVGTRRLGRVYAVVPSEDASSKPEVVTVATRLTMPSGLALIGGDLYVAALNRILKYPDIATTYRDNPQPELITDKLPTDVHHGWKSISVGPDGFLYVPVGAPCNICLRDDERYASILRMDPSTGETTVYAHGVRNSVGMAWHPTTQKLWFSDNGRDWMGDDLPPEEINVVDEPGAHYGYPFVHGDDIEDPEFGDQASATTNYISPVVNIQAHAAALGIDFYTHELFPAKYHNALFIAEHGSWNRSSKVGYRVSVATFVDDELSYESFIDAWLDGEVVSGRPNDVLVTSDGKLLISDDMMGRIYQVSVSAN